MWLRWLSGWVARSLMGRLVTVAEMCLSCELFDCASCDSYEAMPEYGCCCGSIRPEPDDDGPDDDYADYGDHQEADDERRP